MVTQTRLETDPLIVDDPSVMHALRRLRRARVNLQAAQEMDHCCGYHEEHCLRTAKKEIKRWENWLADRDILLGHEIETTDDE